MNSRISSRFDRKTVYQRINLEVYRVAIINGESETVVPFKELYACIRGSFRYKISSRKICGTNRANSVEGLAKALESVKTPNPERIRTVIYEIRK